MKRPLLLMVVLCALVISAAGQNQPAALIPSHDPAREANTPQVGPNPSVNAPYVLVAWTELGMHCIDGKDYSIFSVLPPFNVIHAQLIQKTEPPTLINASVRITYRAYMDSGGSIDTSSSNKTNFWNYVRTLFLNSVPPETGLAGYKTQSNMPPPMAFNATEGYWEAVGIPTVNYDDHMNFKPFSMGQIVATDLNGNQLATATVVLSVSDEMSCTVCHASNSDPNAKPASGWVNNANPAKDVKLNILRKHDDRWPISQYLTQLQANGYTYQSKLYDTALSGTPILCAACHGDNALGLPGLSGINPLTNDMHTLHGAQILISNGKTLDTNSATSDLNSCYLCHPGPNTRCKRGAMNTQLCSACHGNLTTVGIPGRTGWLDVPTCQMCHNNSLRYTTTFTSNGRWRQTTDRTFATTPNVPINGKSLYRYSSGHGTVFCSACHGSPHAEYPSLQTNDNVYPTSLQGYVAKITECTVCHSNLPVSATGGPHGIHTLGQAWVDQGGHQDYVDNYGYQSCAYCHGVRFNGSFLSQSKVQRTFTLDDGQQKNFAAGHLFTCYDCHNGPNGG